MRIFVPFWDHVGAHEVRRASKQHRRAGYVRCEQIGPEPAQFRPDDKGQWRRVPHKVEDDASIVEEPDRVGKARSEPVAGVRQERKPMLQHRAEERAAHGLAQSPAGTAIRAKQPATSKGGHGQVR